MVPVLFFMRASGVKETGVEHWSHMPDMTDECFAFHEVDADV